MDPADYAPLTPRRARASIYISMLRTHNLRISVAQRGDALYVRLARAVTQ